MPLLRELYPGAEGSICRTAEILRREEGCWRELVERVLPERGTEMERRVLLELPYALRLRALRALVERTAVGRKDYGAAHYEAMERLLHGPGGLYTCRRGGGLVRGENFPEKEDRAPETVALLPGGDGGADIPFYLKNRSILSPGEMCWCWMRIK